ncbi:unnamed protein product, partial [Allacma fusca]
MHRFFFKRCKSN